MKMPVLIKSFIVFLIILTLNFSCVKKIDEDYPFQPVPFTDVEINDNFWAPRLKINRIVTIPYAFQQCEETGRIKNFEEAAKVIAGEIEQGTFHTVYPFDDSDVYKIIEGASYALRIQPDPELDDYLDELIEKIAAAQEEDGYLYTARTINAEPPVRWTEGERWSNLYMGHELYNAGHLYEAAVAHYQATGKRNLLDVALKNADLVTDVFGPGRKRGVPGHQEIEIGLVKLYRVTGERKYLDLAKFFLDERGRPEGRELYGEYSQDHMPVVEQTEAVGHAVRAGYMYSGMADVAALTGNSAYVQAIDRIWENVVNKKLYVTGGIGAAGNIEGFGDDYELPNKTAYCETCASIANVLWNHRMFLLHGEAKYIDVMERVLYNGLLSGVGLSGNRFFYPNPLESYGQHERSAWFSCACCPSNISRFMPSIPGYIYAVKKNSIYVNLFVQSTAEINLGKKIVHIRQETNYPWEGRVKLFFDSEENEEITLNVRIPGWARNQPVPGNLYAFLKRDDGVPTVSVNGEEIPVNTQKGYVSIHRKWSRGDSVELSFPLPVRRLLSHMNVVDNIGKTALQRGPLVYCAEWVDNGGRVSNLVLPDEETLEPIYKKDMLGGVTILSGRAEALFSQGEGKETRKEKQNFTAIPYYAWAHRGPGEMAVWIARDEEKALPLPSSSLLASGSLVKYNQVRFEPVRTIALCLDIKPSQ